MWLKYNHKWASGHGEEIQYVEIDPSYLEDNEKKGLTIRNFIEDYDLCKDNNWSDKYRGIDYDVIKKPPNEWIKKKIERCHGRINSLQKSILRYQEMIDGTTPTNS